jgi:hypothetical protein
MGTTNTMSTPLVNQPVTTVAIMGICPENARHPVNNGNMSALHTPRCHRTRTMRMMNPERRTTDPPHRDLRKIVPASTKMRSLSRSRYNHMHKGTVTMKRKLTWSS